MRILTRITASSGIDVSSNNTDTITLGNSIVDKIIANAPITASAGITGSTASFNTLIVDGVQITGSTGAGNLVTSGSVTGSGTEGNPIDLKPNVTITTLTASTGIASGRGDFSSLFVNGNAVSTGSAGGLAFVETSGSITGSGIAGNEIRLKDQINVNSITASFFVGDGHQIGNLTASNIFNFTNDVRSQFSAGTNITINDGVISSSGGSGGTVITQGNITGSGAAEAPVSLKDNISLTSVTASFFSGSGANITNITASNITNFSSNVISLSTIAGTANQVLVNGDTAAASGSVTLSLPQSIATTSSPTFANTTATTGYRLGTSNTYGLDIVNINASNRGIRLVSSSLAGAFNLSGDFVGIGTINGISGILVSSSAKVVNSAPSVILDGAVTSSNTYTLSSSIIQGNLLTNGQITGSHLLIYNTSSLIGPTTLSDTLLTVGSATFLSNLSGTSAQFSSLTVNGVSITGSGGGGGGGSTAYDVAGIYNGKPLSSETIFRFIAVRSFDFSATSADHYFYSAVTSSNTAVFDIYRDATLVGDVTFSSNSGVATVTINSSSFVAGEIFSIIAPSTQDTTLSDLYFTFKADTV